jgi:adenylate cyclase
MSGQARSVLFANISDSELVREKVGDAEAVRAVARCLSRMERIVEALGGRTVSGPDEPLLALFDSTEQAVRAAGEMQQRIADLPPVSGVKLGISIGVAHGSISEGRGRVVGEAVDAATHLARLASPGQLLLSAPTPLPTLRLRYGDQFVVLADRPITMGRDEQNDLVIHDRRASRQQARIERREGRIVLIDSSSNGTYVTLNGEPELFLRGAECAIHGNGLICFAASASSPDVDCAEFES